MRRLTILHSVTLILLVFLLARDIYSDYLYAKCEEASLSGEVGRCTCGSRP